MQLNTLQNYANQVPDLYCKAAVIQQLNNFEIQHHKSSLLSRNDKFLMYCPSLDDDDIASRYLYIV